MICRQCDAFNRIRRDPIDRRKGNIPLCMEARDDEGKQGRRIYSWTHPPLWCPRSGGKVPEAVRA